MLFILPIIFIILVLYVANLFYYEDTKPKNDFPKQFIMKEHNQSAQEYLNKYLDKK